MEHLRECRKLLKKPALEYITVAQEEYLVEVVSLCSCRQSLPTELPSQRISECKIVPPDWVRINGTKATYRYRSPRMQSLLEEREQASERLAAEADKAFRDFLSAISAEYDSFRDSECQDESNIVDPLTL